ncbi:alpha/beta-hydrolase [Xylariaceae sp. FL0255]|nr:alpha/beta-hydrolase [Xylariaceae sp. FL0255]
MRTSTAASLLLSLAVTAVEARSWQHVGKTQRSTNPTQRSDPLSMKEYFTKRNTADHQFLTNKTSSYAVNGSAIPEVDWDIGESYAGYLPISSNPNDTNQLFFWYLPSSENPSKEIVLWLNGGPGCSSLEGFLQENGPFQWQYGTFSPTPNPWAWNRLVNTIWLEQPVGTGFSKGKVTATNEDDIAAAVLGFWQNFIELFAMQGYKVYITGESYAGAYVPYIASAMLDKNDTTYYDLSGIIIYDPVIGNGDVQNSVTTVPFVDYHNDLFPFNDTFNSYIHGLHESCGFADYNAKYLVYPAAGVQPDYKSPTDECGNLWNEVTNEILSPNPCFDVYQVATTCPLLWDVLGFPGSIVYSPTDSGPLYFNRLDVKKAIHADTSIDWTECSNSPVFVHNTDTSLPSAQSKIPHIAEKTNNVIIGHGSLDMILLANGTLLTIQNMTWNGKLGFDNAPTSPFFVPYHVDSTPDDIYSDTNTTRLATIAGAGVMGTYNTERGVTYVSVDLSGHMIPQYAPSAAMRHLEFLLGRVDSLSSVEPFIIYPGITQPASSSLGNGTGPYTYDDSSKATNGSCPTGDKNTSSSGTTPSQGMVPKAAVANMGAIVGAAVVAAVIAVI